MDDSDVVTGLSAVIVKTIIEVYAIPVTIETGYTRLVITVGRIHTLDVSVSDAGSSAAAGSIRTSNWTTLRSDDVCQRAGI